MQADNTAVAANNDLFIFGSPFTRGTKKSASILYMREHSAPSGSIWQAYCFSPLFSRNGLPVLVQADKVITLTSKNIRMVTPQGGCTRESVIGLGDHFHKSAPVVA